MFTAETSSHNEVCTRQVNEEENHSVLVVERHPLPQQVDQGVGVGRQSHHQLETVHGDADDIG